MWVVFPGAGYDVVVLQKTRVIGGVFFLANDSGKDLALWYEKHLGLSLESWGGAILKWEEDTASDKGITVWGTANPGSSWFAPSKSPFMINYRIDNMQQVRSNGTR